MLRRAAAAVAAAALTLIVRKNGAPPAAFRKPISRARQASTLPPRAISTAAVIAGSSGR